jgi:DNA-binding NarL/FixJ family response regulator
MLSSNEAEIMRCITTGLTDAEIAARLGWEEQRVKDCIHGLCRKLGASSRIELILYACTMEGQAALGAVPPYVHDVRAS